MTTANTENVNFSIMDLYDRIYVNNRTFDDFEYVLNCPIDEHKPYGKTCYDCVYDCVYQNGYYNDYYEDYYIYCNRKFTDILDGWNIKTDKILDIVKNEYGIITKVTVLKNRKQKTFIYPHSKIGDTLYELVYNTKSACIIVFNQRTRKEFKIGTRYHQRHRGVQIEGYLRENYYDKKGNYHYEFYDDRLPIYYANKPEWIIVWENGESEKSGIGDTLSKFVYNTKSACIIVLNQRTRKEFKIGTRYHQRHRDVPIEGYLRENNGGFNGDRLRIDYADEPEWEIVWEGDEKIL